MTSLGISQDLHGIYKWLKFWDVFNYVSSLAKSYNVANDKRILTCLIQNSV